MANTEVIIELSRLQFALTAMYHFIFVPLTLGLAFILAIMETVYVKTGNPIWKDMTKFWGKLFGINFALGVATGLSMEFQFGTNWSTYSSYVGDIFGAPLAVEGMMAFFLESTMIGLFFFGWDRMSKTKHLLVTYCVAFGSNLSALWILVANGWMQFPGVEGLLHQIQSPNPELTAYVSSVFNPETLRMEMTDFFNLILSPVAQAKFAHTVSAGYVTGAVFVLSISSYYLLKKRDIEFAKCSFGVASVFGLIMCVNLIYMGDDAGVDMRTVQPVKLASIEGEWHTEKAPAAFNLIAFPNQKEEKNDFAIKIPALLGLLTTHSLDTEVTGLIDLKAANQERINQGVIALKSLYVYQQNKVDLMLAKKEIAQTNNISEDDVTDDMINDYQTLLFAEYEQNKTFYGYGLLAKQFIELKGLDINTATDADWDAAKIEATQYSIPQVAPLFWSFRIMVGIGGLLLILFIVAVYMTMKNTIGMKPLISKLMLLALPLPWIASECGWFVNEYGRQPWAIDGVLPTGIAHSTLSLGDLIFSLVLIIGLYSVFLFVELFLMFKYARKGPSSLGTGKYHFELDSQHSNDQKGA